MADILTVLRELSVCLSIYNKDFDIQNISPQQFLSCCKDSIVNCDGLSLSNISENKHLFNQKESRCIKNGATLGVALRHHLGNGSCPTVEWVGHDIHNNMPIDVIVNGNPISLKENSYILENMGIYSFLNTLKGYDAYPKGLHAFETFSRNELDRWYNVIKSLLLERGDSFAYKSKKYISYGEIVNNTLKLSVSTNKKDYNAVIQDFSGSTYNSFKKSTTSILREKVFSKWISQNLKDEQVYIEAKRECAIAAGERIIESIKDVIGTSPHSLLRMFRLGRSVYYYAKASSNEACVYEVPSLESVSKDIIIENVEYVVPNTQLSIITTLRDRRNNNKAAFRNEIRYSHGQLNGAPEAKLYFMNNDIPFLYRKISNIEHK